MKKIAFTILFALIGIMSVNAQEADSLQLMELNARIDSLTTKVNKLQLNYDFLYCQLRISEIENNLEDFISNTSIKSNSMLIEYYNSSKTNVDLYVAYKGLYDAMVRNFDSLKESATVIKELVISTMISTKFSDEELSALTAGCDHIDSCISAAQASLGYFKVTLDAYKNK